MRRAAVAGVAALSIAGGSMALAAAMPVGAVLAQDSGSTTTTPSDPAQPGRPGPGKALSGILGSLVDDGTITPEQSAKIKERFDAAAAKARQGLAEKRDAMREKFGAKLDEIAAVIGIAPADLKEQLKTKSLGEIAGAKKGELVTYLTNAINTRVDEAVTNGRLTKDQADKVKAETASRVAKLVDAVGGGKGPMGRPGGMRGRPGR